MPSSVSANRLSRFSEARLAVSRVAPAYWSEGDHGHAGKPCLQRVEEAGFALFGGRGPFLVAEEEHGALPVEQLAHAPPRELAALAVVGRDVADLLARVVQGGIEDHGGDAGLGGLLDGPHEGMAVERGEDDAVDALADEALDHLELLLAVVLAQGSLPEHLDRHALRAKLRRGLLGPEVHALPVLVGGALGHHRDAVALRGVGVPAPDQARGEQDRSGTRAGRGHHHAMIAPDPPDPQPPDPQIPRSPRSPDPQIPRSPDP